MEVASYCKKGRPVTARIGGQLRKNTHAAKKWQVPSYATHMTNWNLGYADFHQNNLEGKQLSIEQIKNEISTLKSMSHLYQIYYECRKNKEHDKIFRQHMIRVNPRTELIELFKNVTSDFSSGYTTMLGLELMSGYWKEDSNSFRQSAFDDCFYIPCSRPWAADIHVRRAKAFLIKNYHRIKPNEEFPSKEIDLRVSGMIIGTSFRFKCPEPLSKEWHEIHFTDEEFGLIKLHESRYYQL